MFMNIHISLAIAGLRRHLKIAGATRSFYFMFLLSLSFASSGLAQVRFVYKQAPGYYRFTLGTYEITALHDGNGPIDASLMQGDKTEIKCLLQGSFGSNSYEGSDAGFLINTGKKLILIDSGTGGVLGGPEHQLVENLKASGYEPSQVDLILLTHMHYDHLGGITTKDGRRVFPNAEVRMAKAESDFWLSKRNGAAASNELQTYFRIAHEAAAPYIAAHKWTPFVGIDELGYGIIPVPLTGHTPGHFGYQVTSGGKTILFWGDTVNVEPIQMSRPGISIAYDMDPTAASKTREALFAKLANSGTAVAGPHMPWPSIGYVRKDGNGYKWLPAISTVGISSIN
jgi:glyoxylase-like metal-dependent hydrolase (beta-lactamase superfamily II)